MKKFSEFCGWLGMLFIQGATVPTTLGILNGESVRLPEISLVLMVSTGLALYFIRAVGHRDFLHIVSNGIGFFLQASLLALTLYQ